MVKLAIGSKLRGCALVWLKISDMMLGRHAVSRALVMQHETLQSVRFELTEQTRDAIEVWIEHATLETDGYVVPSRVPGPLHVSTRKYARIVKRWAVINGRNPNDYDTHSLRRTKATLVYRRTKNLRAVQRLLAHPGVESTARYLGIEVAAALGCPVRNACTGF